MLAHPYNPVKCFSIGGWYASEKLDGIRAFWDGGFTRGKLASEVPFANTEKDGRYISQPRATGLWTRYGKTIQAPDWWLDTLPKFPLDGELYMGRGSFQQTGSTIKQLVPDDRWKNVKFMIFDSPPRHVVFGPGEIKNTNFKKTIPVFDYHSILILDGPEFYKTHRALRSLLQRRDATHELLMQEELPLKQGDALKRLGEITDNIIRAGGEGVMLRHPTSFWVPQRSWQLVKCKPYQDSEATVIGSVWGRRTDLGSKLLGLMGALILDWNGKRFELSGFTDQERQMHYKGDKTLAFEEGVKHPGEIATAGFENVMFPIGSKVTFKYRELTDEGLPKEARYWRKAE